jgi:hypothetical protein
MTYSEITSLSPQDIYISTFQDEYRAFLKRHNVSFDER